MRIALPSSEDAAFRRQVDAELKEVLLEDSFDLGVDVIEVTGSREARVQQVREYLADENATDQQPRSPTRR